MKRYAPARQGLKEHVLSVADDFSSLIWGSMDWDDEEDLPGRANMKCLDCGHILMIS